MISDIELNYLSNKLHKWAIEDSSIGIITAADHNVFVGLQVLYASIKNKVNFICYDLGLTKSQLEWCKDNKLKIVPLSNKELLQEIPNWQTYCKPLAFRASPFEYSVWIDTDCIIVGDLSNLNHIANRETFFTKHWVESGRIVKNKPTIYEKYPVDFIEDMQINAGVIGLNANHYLSNKILTDWLNIITTCASDPSFLSNFSAWDEGILLWAIQHNNAYELIETEEKYNNYAAIGKSPFDGFCIQNTPVFSPSAFTYKFFEQISAINHGGILHFSSCMKNDNKYWKMWPLK